jgi:hypothetical protein
MMSTPNTHSASARVNLIVGALAPWDILSITAVVVVI